MVLSEADKEKQLFYLDLQLDVYRQMVYREDLVIKLSRIEFALLKELVDYQGIVVSRTHLFAVLWSFNLPADTQRLTVHICNLRRKLDKPFLRKLIHTVPQTGYILE